MPPSRSSLLVTGEVQVACCTRWKRVAAARRSCRISGDGVAVARPNVPGRARSAADDPLIVGLLPAAFVVARPGGALTRMLLVPEQIELVTRRGLHGQPQVGDPPAPGRGGRPGQVRHVDVLRRVAGIQVRDTCPAPTASCLPRATLKKYQMRSFMIGPPTPPVKSHSFSSSPGARRPAACSSSV